MIRYGDDSGVRMDNIDVAILMKLNELAERHGLKPQDFLANTVHLEGAGTVLLFEGSPSEPDEEKKFKAMLGSLGMNEHDQLGQQGGYVEILNALDHALSIAPNSRRRF